MYANYIYHGPVADTNARRLEINPEVVIISSPQQEY